MKRDSVRITIEIPVALYRKLKEQAAAKGTSVPQLVLAGVRVTVLSGRQPHSKKVQFPLIKSKEPKANLTNERIFEHIEFP